MALPLLFISPLLLRAFPLHHSPSPHTVALTSVTTPFKAGCQSQASAEARSALANIHKHGLMAPSVFELWRPPETCAFSRQEPPHQDQHQARNTPTTTSLHSYGIYFDQGDCKGTQKIQFIFTTICGLFSWYTPMAEKVVLFESQISHILHSYDDPPALLPDLTVDTLTQILKQAPGQS